LIAWLCASCFQLHLQIILTCPPFPSLLSKVRSGAYKKKDMLAVFC
jgi:hypothetical protein